MATNGIGVAGSTGIWKTEASDCCVVYKRGKDECVFVSPYCCNTMFYGCSYFSYYIGSKILLYSLLQFN
jgi:hypothetical protein